MLVSAIKRGQETMNRLNRIVAAGLVATAVAGCAATDEQRTRAEGAGVGAVVGGLLGYAIDRERGALIGAAIGAGAGYAVGNEIAKRKQAYATTEEFLDAEIARVDEFNRTTTAYNARVRQDIVRLEHEAEQLRARYDSGQVQKAGLQAKRNELQQHIATSQELEETLAAEYEIQTVILQEERANRAADDPYIVRLEREVQALQENLEALREGSTQLARIDQRLSV
ncbi:membrane protein [Thioalkalivibrio nitratireducens DSM 14787]|uniref:Membrane protein n=2 Tax=Thioalkalivibrio nitratireducens TaxID=186931 RepID=L0DYY4_THIND|nr:membrane protein [Thioalkalivibrio nitratireducens DSM 14787]